MNGHDLVGSLEFDKRQYSALSEQTTEGRSSHSERFKNSKGRTTKFASTSLENGNFMPVLLEEDDYMNTGVSSNWELEQSHRDMSSHKIHKPKHQKSSNAEQREKKSSQKTSNEGSKNRNTDGEKVQYLMRTNTSSSKTRESTMTSEKQSGRSEQSGGYEFPELHDDDDFDMDDIDEKYEGNDIYVFYLMTDEGAIIGPFRMDIENVQIGLPTSVEKVTSDNDEGISQ